MKTTIQVILFLLGLVLFLVLTSLWIDSGNKEMMRDWASTHNANIESIEYRALSTGPFHWNSKTSRVYMVTLSTGKIVWFRFGDGFKGMEVKQESVDF